MIMSQPDLGLIVAHEPSTPSADLVFVHGLNGHRSLTWTNKSNEFWLPWLGKDLPDVRVWTYGYNARAVFGSQDVLDIDANTFLSNISSSRNDRDNDVIHSEKPIVFVAHSLGGILVKKAMIIASTPQSGFNAIFQNTRGIVFLGTPHRGAHIANRASLLIKCIPCLPSSRLLHLLRAQSSLLAQIAEEFNNIWGSRPIFSFRETTGMFGFGMIVRKENAKTNCRNEQVVDIEKCNHSEISKPDSVQSTLFTEILDAIVRELSPDASPTLSHPPTQTGSIHDERRVWRKSALPEGNVMKRLFREFNGSGEISERPPGEWQCLAEFEGSRWRGGSYWASFTADESETTIIRARVNQGQISWSISSPRSLWYPGTHSGTMVLSGDYPFTPPKVRFSTRIFSPYVTYKGAISPGITFRDNWKVKTTILEILNAIAIMLVLRPFYGFREYSLPGFHPHSVLEQDIETYFNNDKDAFLRATNFFSRAFAHGMVDLEHSREVRKDEVEVTVKTITELLDYFSGSDPSRVLLEGFSKSTIKPAFERVQTLQDFLTEEKRWASVVESICYSQERPSPRYDT